MGVVMVTYPEHQWPDAWFYEKLAGSIALAKQLHPEIVEHRDAVLRVFLHSALPAGNA